MSRTCEIEGQYELTEEGKRLWENIVKYEQTSSKRSQGKLVSKLPPLEINPYKAELEHIQLEIEKMITHSKKVVRDCELILSKVTNAQEYLTSDAKIAKELHSRLINRLQNILNGKAFDQK